VSSTGTVNATPALPPALRGPIGIAAVLAAGVAAVLAAHHSGDVASGRLDRWVQTAVESGFPQPGAGALLIDFVGEPLVGVMLTVLLAVVCVALGRRRLAMAVVPATALLVDWAGKGETG
jgi:uncharacterized membrane protein